MCFSEAKWKREQIPDHKFDFVDVDDFVDKSVTRRLLYLGIFIVVMKSVLVNVADLWTMILLLISPGWSSSIKPDISLTVSRWVFVGSIAASFLLLFIEFQKTRRVIRSRDIAYGLTCIGAYRFYCVRSYAHYCLFSTIDTNHAFKDRVAFFCFFVLKGWKRFLFAEAPRQVINAITLAGVYFVEHRFRPQQFWEFSENWTERVTIALMTFSFIIWALTALRLLCAFVTYIPLLCAIRGNLKEYCCHKIDKRIAKLLRQKSRARILQEQLERQRLEKELAQAGGQQLVQPTLPIVGDFDPESLPIHEENVKLEVPVKPFGRSSPGLPPGGSPSLHAQSLHDPRPSTPLSYPSGVSTPYAPSYTAPSYAGSSVQANAVMLPVGFPVVTNMQPIYDSGPLPMQYSTQHEYSSTSPGQSVVSGGYAPTQISHAPTQGSYTATQTSTQMSQQSQPVYAVPAAYAAPPGYAGPPPRTNTTLPPYTGHGHAQPVPPPPPQEGEERYAANAARQKRWND